MHARDLNVVGAWLLTAADAVDTATATAGLAHREAAALILVAGHPGVGIEWLRERVGLTQSGAVRLVDRLVAAGWLVRGAESSRRSVGLHVTDDGQRQTTRVLADRAQALTDLLSPLTDDERRSLAALADRMLAAAERRRGEADRACRLCSWPTCRPDCPVDRSVPAGRP
jgi:DNA-binding MarR family transcriptional regulator